MRTPEGFQQHWLEIDGKRLARYGTMFRWDPNAAHFFDAAQIGEGLEVADFGCGPGDVAVEFARRVGDHGHVHGLDINRTFLQMAKAKAKSANVDRRFTPHLLTDGAIP